MKKFVTALIVVLPLLLLVAVFAVTNIARISAQIPVAGLQIENKGDGGIFVFDMADYETPMYEDDLGITVLPYVASNKKYNLNIVDADTNEPTDIIAKDENGAFALIGIGKAKLIYTSQDGGYSDSVLFNVISSKALDVTPTLKDNSDAEFALTAGDTTDFKTTVESGEYVIGSILYPITATASTVSFASSNPTSLNVDENTGRIEARFSGREIITLTVNSTDGTSFEKTIEFNVVNSASNGITINGLTYSHTVLPLASNGATFFVEAPISDASLITAEGVHIESFIVEKLSGISDHAYKVVVNFKESRPSDSLRLNIKVADETVPCYVDFAEYEFEIYSAFNAQDSRELVVLNGENTLFNIVCTPRPEHISYSWEVLSQQVASVVDADGSTCTIAANEVGRTTIRVFATEYDKNGNAIGNYTVTRTLVSTPKYSSLIFGENSATYGLADVLAIANNSYDANGNLKTETYNSSFVAYSGKNKVDSFEDIVFTSSSPYIADVENTASGIVFNVYGTGRVTITAEFKYGEKFHVAPTSFTFDTVDGVYVSTYADIMRASEHSKKIVLKNDISLGEQLFDVAANGSRTQKYSDARMLEILQSETKTLKTTADWTYYNNLGEGQPSVRYCLEFTNDVYGNGFSIDADNIVNMIDSTGHLYDFAVFAGPLDFVSTSRDGIKLAAVKAQDNIVFLARKDNLVITNVTLKGVNTESLMSDDALDLTLLNNAGTTLEVMSDASVTYTRVMNGRTVVRVFGRDGINQATQVRTSEKIHVTIEGCVLQNAREFILKLGTNRFLRGTETKPSPTFVDKNGKEYKNYNRPACDNYANDEYFVENYVLTDVVLKDSTLKTSGLFSIGIESHFAGPMLAGSDAGLGASFKLEGWEDLAGTSYPAELHLVGNVVLDDWKSLDAVDSSTLIETASSNSASLSFLNLNVKEMLLAVQQYGGDTYKDIVTTIDGSPYAHGGIAMYGGGKNYSIVDMSEYTNTAMKQFNINLNILANSDDRDLHNQGTLLPAAAGYEDFRFIMFDKSNCPLLQE